jgi:hypothetical protein
LIISLTPKVSSLIDYSKGCHGGGYCASAIFRGEAGFQPAASPVGNRAREAPAGGVGICRRLRRYPDGAT